MPLKPPTLPSPSPLPPRPKPHFGGEGIPTPISLKFPQSSSAGSAISPGGPSHLGDPSLLRGSAAGDTGHTDPIPPPLPPAGSKVRTFSDGLFSQRIKDNFGVKNLSIDIPENSSMPIWKEGVAYIKAGGTIFPVRTSRFANDGETWEIYSPSDPTKPGHAVKFEATGWKSNNNTGLQGGAPVDPRLAPYRAPDDLEEMRIEYRAGYERDKVHEKISYDEGRRDAGYIKFVDGHHYRWRDFVSTRPSGERIVERRLVTQDQQIGPLLVLEEMTGLWSLHWQPVDTWLPGPPPVTPPPSPPPGSSTAPKRPHLPDGAQPLPTQRPRIDEAQSLPPGRGMGVKDMPAELTNGSEGFWNNKTPATRQLAVNLFRDGKIHDITYRNGGKGINGTFNYGGNEYRFSYSAGVSARVTFQDMDGNVANPRGIKGLDFAPFLGEIERRTSVPLAGGINAAQMPQELTNGSEGFWDNKDPETRQLAANLFRDGKIHDITYRNGGKSINGTFNYGGNEYRFSYSAGVGARVTFQDMDGNVAEPYGIKGPYFAEFLRQIERRTSVQLTGGMDAAHMPPELTNGSGGFWENKGPATQQSAVNLFRDGRIRDVTYPNGGREINGTFNYGGNEYRFFFSGGKGSKVTVQDMDGNVADPGIKGLYFARFLSKIERETPAPLIGAPPAASKAATPGSDPEYAR